MRRIALALALVVVASPRAFAQDVFHSTQSANLPTALVMPQGSWLFEISHRFDTPISDGASALWGLDGPVRNRLALTYSVIDRVALGVQRSNFDDNVDVNVKVGALSLSRARFALETAAIGGVAWNTQVFEVDGAEDNEMQAYGQLAVNARIGTRIALGVVPTYLYNPRLRDFDEDNAFALGVNGQFYFTDSMSLLGEWLVGEKRPEQEKDAATFGLEIETRGHFFKLLVTNQAVLNPTQFLAGTPTPFEPDEWRLGFNIQRLLPF
jgi:hypothetical protein